MVSVLAQGFTDHYELGGSHLVGWQEKDKALGDRYHEGE